jgi:chaperonin cofactor prefoldin
MKAIKYALTMLLVPCLIAATIPAGSLTTFGESTELSGVAVKSGAAVFPGDSIKTGAGGALFTLSSNRSIQIGPNSEVRVGKDSSVEIVRGMSRVQAKSQGFAMVASDWKLQGQPDSKTGLLTADVVREADGKISLNVGSGRVSARSNRGNVVMVAQVGRPLMLPASIPAPPDPPQGASSGVSKGVVVAAILGAAGLGAGIAAIATQDDNSDLKAQLVTLSSQNASLTSQIASLRSSLNAVAAAAQQVKALSDSLNAALVNLNNLQNQLAAVQAQINTLVAKVASGQPLSAADQATLANLQAQQAALATQITAATNTVNAIIASIRVIPFPTPTP